MSNYLTVDVPGLRGKSTGLARDKQLHIAAVFAITVCVGLLLGPVTGIFAAVFLSVAKEGYDMLYKNAAPKACAADLLADLCGMSWGVAILLLASLL